MGRGVNGFPVWNILKSVYLILSSKGIYFSFLFPRGSPSRNVPGLKEETRRPYYYRKAIFTVLSFVQSLRDNFTIQLSENIETMFKALLSIWYEYLLIFNRHGR